MKPKYNPSSYLPLFGNEFFQAVEGYPDSIGMAYLHALWHYWHHFHCEGLPNDDDYLRRVCHCLVSDWNRTKGVIFDNDKFFKLDQGKWHQGRAMEEHSRSVEIYRNRVRSASNARKHNPIHSPENKVEINPETNSGTKVGSKLYLSQSQSSRNKQTNNGHPELKEVLDAASMSGMPEADATDFWNHFESSGWIDKNGHPIVNWRSKMATWKTVARAASFQASSKSVRAATASELRTIIEAKNALAAQIRTKHCSDAAMGQHWDDDDARNEFFKLKRESKKLQVQLSNMA